MSATTQNHPTTQSQRQMRIGEVAERTGTTPRTIRYYEEIGLLGPVPEREQGKHRSYTESDVERIDEVVRLKELLGLSLEQLSQLLEAEAARAELRREYHQTEDPGRQKEIVEQALGHIGTQISLVRTRLEELNRLEGELIEKQRRVRARLRELS